MVLPRFLAQRALLTQHKAMLMCRKWAGSEGLAGVWAALQTNALTKSQWIKKSLNSLICGTLACTRGFSPEPIQIYLYTVSHALTPQQECYSAIVLMNIYSSCFFRRGKLGIYGKNIIKFSVTKQYPVIRKDSWYIDIGSNKMFLNKFSPGKKPRSMEHFQLLQNNGMWKRNSYFLCLIVPLPILCYLSKMLTIT